MRGCLRSCSDESSPEALLDAQDGFARWGRRYTSTADDLRTEKVLLAGLGLGLRETLDFLMTGTPSFEEFEAWVLAKNGGAIAPARVERLNNALRGDGTFALESILPEPVLSSADLAFWDEHGYIVVKRAVSVVACQAAVEAILAYAGMSMEQPDSWYNGGLWIPLAHHPALWANRNSARIHTAFAQIWGRRDLWVNVDVCGVNPPLRQGNSFQGTPLHWDMTLAPPLRFGTQAILYLTDTAANQGAFSCVPGFHRRLEAWLKEHPEPRAMAPWRQENCRRFPSPAKQATWSFGTTRCPTEQHRTLPPHRG